MKLITLIVITLISFVGLSTEKIIELDKFFNVNVIGNFKVTLIKGESYKVKVINNDKDVLDENIVVESDGGELIIRLKKDTYIERSLEFIVYYNELFNIKAKRGGYVTGQDVLTSESINVEVASGGHVQLNINSKSANFSIKNGGTIDVKGHVEGTKCYISKGGNIIAPNLLAQSASAEVLFGGEIILNVTNSLVAVVKSGGVIKYKGKPDKVSEEIKIGGRIVKLDE
jgi:hypothetical protein